MKNFSLLALWFLSFSILLPNVAQAKSIEVQNTSPYVVLEKVGNKLFSRISTSQQEIKKFPALMRIIVDEELMPSIDYKYVSYRILGKNLKTTTKDQRADFVNSMRNYLVRTYANALMQYKNQQVVFEKEKATKGKKIVGVKAQIIAMNSPTIDLVFKLRKNKKTGQWKIFDMVVEGISLLDSKQAELNSRIAKQGLDQVTIELTALTKG